MLLLVFMLVFVATIFIPGLVIEVLVVNTLLVFYISLLQIGTALFAKFQPQRVGLRRFPFVSVLVPAYNEPPALLMQTLDMLSRVNYPNFEVAVIDNNTKDQHVWRPIERFCRVLGPRFQFFHVDNLPGFKAGALNFALERINPASEYIAVIDADYVVNKDFIATALSYFTNEKIALVQFPQDYRNTIASNQPIADEYHHFFKIYMNMANRLDCVPSTGTVSIYTARSISAIGGFHTEMLTEDADAGLRICKAGYRGVYVERPIGHGLMPYDIEAYRKQKRRWAMGNAQSLWTLFSLFGKISMRSWFGFLAHLTAWDHFHFLPFAVLAGYTLVVTPLIPTTGVHRMLLDIASLSIFITLLSKLILFFVTLRGEKHAIPRALRAFVVHMGMTFLYSEAMMHVIFRKGGAFERTNKFILINVPNVLKSTYKELLLGVWFLSGAISTVLFGGRVITFTAFMVSAIALLSVYYVYWALRPTKAYSKKLLAEAESKYRLHLMQPPVVIGTSA